VQTIVMVDRSFICETCGVTIIVVSDRDKHELKVGHSRLMVHVLAARKTRMQRGNEIDL